MTKRIEQDGWNRAKGASKQQRVGRDRMVCSPSARRRPLGYERLEQRQLLAVLTVGATGQYATIQAAVDRARSGDTIEVQAGSYQESVDLSRMGSAVNQSPGNLQVRGVGTGSALVVSPGGPTFFNSQPFTGNLTLRDLSLQAPSPTAAPENGVRLDRFAGRLLLSGLTIESTRESLIEIRNSSGNLEIDSNILEDSGTFIEDHGIVLDSLTGVVTVSNNQISNLRGDGIHLSAAGQQELVALVARNQIAGEATSLTTTRRGIVLQASEQAVLHAVVQGNLIDQVTDRGLVMKLEGAARFSGSLHGNTLLGTRSISSDLRIEGTARADFSLVSNDFRETKASGLFLSLGNEAEVRARLVRNMFFEIGDAVGEDAVVVTNDASSSTRLHLFMDANDFRQARGHGTLVQGVGNGLFNLAFTDNSYTAMNSLHGTSAVLIGQPDLTSNTTFNVRFSQNIVNQAVQGSYRFEQRGSGTFRLEGSASDAAAQIAATNQTGSLPGQLTSVGTISLIGLNTLADTVPLAIGDRVWRDTDANGIQDDTETGLGRVVLALSGTEAVSGLAVFQRTISDLDGFYQFNSLLPGTYTLRLEPLLGNAISPQNQGGSSSLDSDYSPLTRTIQVTLPSLSSRENIDLGLIVNWQNPLQNHDANGDGQITPLDALVVINYLNANVNNPNLGILPLPPAPPRLPPPYLDVDGDNFATPSDARVVINELNRRISGGGGGGGEGEAAMFTALRPVNGLNSFDARQELARRFTRGTRALHQSAGEAEKPLIDVSDAIDQIGFPMAYSAATAADAQLDGDSHALFQAVAEPLWDDALLDLLALARF